MTIGENIKRIRKEKGLTQKQLGSLCQMADSAIRRYELGKARPKLETIHKIATGLGVPVRMLVDLNMSWASSLPYPTQAVPAPVMPGMTGCMQTISIS